MIATITFTLMLITSAYTKEMGIYTLPDPSAAAALWAAAAADLAIFLQKPPRPVMAKVACVPSWTTTHVPSTPNYSF
jgi:hypothetical protein